jgi:hypothetical protein
MAMRTIGDALMIVQFNLLSSRRENETDDESSSRTPARLEHQFAPAEWKPQEYFLVDNRSYRDALKMSRQPREWAYDLF